MKYMVLSLCISLCAINANDMDTTQLHYIPDKSNIPLLSKHYQTAQQAIALKDFSVFKQIVPELTTKEQYLLHQQAQCSLGNTPSTLKSFAKNSFCFSWGLGIIAAGSLDFLLNYASSIVDSTCRDKCSTITKEIHLTDDPEFCNKLCSTISQDKLHALAVPTGFATITLGVTLSSYSVYSFIKGFKNKRNLKAIVAILQTNDYCSDDDTENSDSTEIV